MTRRCSSWPSPFDAGDRVMGRRDGYDPCLRGPLLARYFDRLMQEQDAQWVRVDTEHVATISVLDRSFTMRLPSNASSDGFWWEVKADSWRASFHTIPTKENRERIADYVFSGSAEAFENDLVMFRLVMEWGSD